jgi:hypothetical protein
MFRIDIDEELGEFGVGRVMRDLDLPPGWGPQAGGGW